MLLHLEVGPCMMIPFLNLLSRLLRMLYVNPIVPHAHGGGDCSKIKDVTKKKHMPQIICLFNMLIRFQRLRDTEIVGAS
jgi:hypothetical protein